MTEPQVWRLIGVFAVAMFALIGIVTSSFNRTVKATIGGVRSEISRLRDIMGARFETMDARFETLDVKFSDKFEVLDRDIQALSRHVFGTDLR